MASTFDGDFNELLGDFSSLFGEVVSIKRGGNTTSGIVAQKLLGNREQTDVEGIFQVTFGCDWIFTKSDYAFFSSASEPEPGDRIVDSDGAEWEVLPIDGDHEVVDLPGGVEWLVRTKRAEE